MSTLKRTAWLNRVYGEFEVNNTQLKIESDFDNIVLFDLDGTLTEARQVMSNSMIPVLKDLAEVAEIGIVTGSDYRYLVEQVDYLMNTSQVRYKLHLLPCNGTKYYKPPTTAECKHELFSESNMKDRIGSQVFKDLMSFLIGRQARIRYSGIPLTGQFFDYRGSMINWCPIGRNANREERNYFVDYDLSYEVRLQEMKAIENFLSERNYSELVTIKLGGDTSFDIYPKGWDKTYCLRHFENKNYFFVGDRCSPSGNDYELYNHLNALGRSFETKGPFNTECIIREKIIPIIKEGDNEEK